MSKPIWNPYRLCENSTASSSLPPSSSSSSQPFMPLLADGLQHSRHALRSWAALIHWLQPTSSMLSFHLLLGLLLTCFSSLGVHSDVILAHLVLLILATCPAHCPLMQYTLSIIIYRCFRSVLVLHRGIKENKYLSGFQYLSLNYALQFIVTFHVHGKKRR